MGASRDFGTVSQEWSLDWTIDPFSGNDSTVAMWARVDNFDSNGIVFFGTNTNASVWWQVTSTAVFIHSSSISYSSGIDDGNWHHLAFTSDATGTERIFYLDGVNVASAASLGTALATGNKSFRLGRWIGGTSFTLDGNLAHFHFDDNPWSHAKVNQAMRYPMSVTSQLYCPIWGLSDPEPDLSGNGYDASVDQATESSDGPPVSFGEPVSPMFMFPAAAPGGTTPKGVFGHPLHGPLGGPV